MNKQFLLILFMVVSAVVSCSKDETGEKLAAEDQKLAEYIQTNVPNATNIAGGIYLEELSQNDEAPMPEAGKFVLIDYTLRTLYDNALERISYNLDKYEEKPMYYPAYKYGGPEIWQLSAPLERDGISDCIGKMHESETANIYFSSRHNFFYPYADFTTRKLWFKLVKTIDDLTKYQESLMNNYLKERYSGKTDTVMVQSSIDNNQYRIFYRIINEGTGDKITGDVTLKSTVNALYLLQEGHSQEYMSDKTDMEWRTTNSADVHTKTKTNCIGEILLKMKKGGEVVIALPYFLYYGNKDSDVPRNEKDQCLAPMNSALVFRIKLNN